MKVDGFNWDEGNWPKCGKHGLSQADIEAFLQGTMTVLPDPYDGDESRFRAICTDHENRYAFVVFCIRMVEEQLFIRPINARYMHRKEIDTYEKENR